VPRVALVTVAVVVGIAAACHAPGKELPPASDPLPGATARPAAVEEKLREAVAAKGPTYRPRTRHLRPDGSARYTNRLVLRPSPYLLQHAHNPVDWYPWGDEAFERARAERKPVLLSVGYSTCHWCHVMEEESFEDEEIARYLNAHYVAVKVDREEQPDVDETYMTAVQLLTGGGGWPMTVWLTPERLPFFAGTYFPARDGDRGAPVGFLSLLSRLRESFDGDPEGVARRADEITASIRRLAARAPGDALPVPGVLKTAVDQHRRRFDAEHGGFGTAPKFPLPAALWFLLRYHRRSGDASVLAMVTRTLDGMAGGGIYDQIGGGFHRYATDAAWQVPHFEKMLYDNAQLAVVYLEAYQVTKNPEHARIVRETLDYLVREMRAPGGGFYAASDADSEGEEGTFFVWTPAQIAAALDPAAAAAVLATYGVTEAGNFEGRNVLHRARPLAEVAADLGTEPERLADLLADARTRLRAVRGTRVAPHVDTKVLVVWNGLAISAFARAGAVFGEAAYVEQARAAADFILGSMRPGGGLFRSYADGRPYQDAFLEDYAALALGLLDLYEATFETRWLEEAARLHAALAARFWDEPAGGFFMTAEGPGNSLAREKPDYDGATPSGNALAVEGLLRLAELTGDDRHRRMASRSLQALAEGITRSPSGATRLLAAYEFLLDRPREIVIVRPGSGDDDGAALLATVHGAFVPNRMLTVAREGDELARQQALIPLVAEKRALGGRSTAYVCELGVCELPTADPAVLARQLAKVHPLPADAGGD
jgi:uncharacterized protein YyaL (SSP411 family)